jgi:hypothetical protein
MQASVGIRWHSSTVGLPAIASTAVYTQGWIGDDVLSMCPRSRTALNRTHGR